MAAILAALVGWPAPVAHGSAISDARGRLDPAAWAAAIGDAPDGRTRAVLPVPAAQSTQATLEAARPEVEWSEVGLTSWRSVPSRQSVGAGDRVRTGSSASARLTYFDNSVVEIAPNTGLLVQRLERSPSGDLISNLFVSVGSVLSRIVPQTGTGGTVDVETPAAIGRVRGTTPRVEVTSDGTTVIGNLPDNTGGQVQVEGKDPLTTQVTVPSGFQTLIRPGQPPSEPYRLQRQFTIRYCQALVCGP
jgi:hypothetical protein